MGVCYYCLCLQHFPKLGRVHWWDGPYRPEKWPSPYPRSEWKSTLLLNVHIYTRPPSVTDHVRGTLFYSTSANLILPYCNSIKRSNVVVLWYGLSHNATQLALRCVYLHSFHKIRKPPQCKRCKMHSIMRKATSWEKNARQVYMYKMD